MNEQKKNNNQKNDWCRRSYDVDDGHSLARFHIKFKPLSHAQPASETFSIAMFTDHKIPIKWDHAATLS